MSIDSHHTGFDVLSKVAFTDVVDFIIVIQSTDLMELPVKDVDVINGTGIEEETIPESWTGKRTEVLFIVLDDFREVPREGQHI